MKKLEIHFFSKPLLLQLKKLRSRCKRRPERQTWCSFGSITLADISVTIRNKKIYLKTQLITAMSAPRRGKLLWLDTMAFYLESFLVIAFK